MFIEDTGVPEGGLELVLDFFSVHIISPEQSSKNILKFLLRIWLTYLSLMYAFAVPCIALLLPAKIPSFQGLSLGVGVSHLLLIAESLPLQISVLHES